MQPGKGAVLVVEDDPIISEMLVAALGQYGYEAHAAPCETVLPIAMALQPAVIVLDLHMHISGESIYRELRAEPTTAGIPILISSAVRGALAQAAALGAEKAIEKPFTLDALEHEVDQLAELRRARLAGCSGEKQA